MSTGVSIFILSFSYLLAELAHWLPITTSKSLANEMKFGNYNASCINATNQDCYEGTGTEVQAIFSVYFVIPISITTIIFGYLADLKSRRIVFAGALFAISIAQLAITFRKKEKTIR